MMRLTKIFPEDHHVVGWGVEVEHKPTKSLHSWKFETCTCLQARDVTI